MNQLVENYLSVMRNYAQTTGRASRYEYWMFVLAFAGLMFAALLIEAVLGIGNENVRPLAGIVSIGHLVPNVTVTVRRLHDTGRGGLWLLLCLTVVGAVIPFVFALMQGDSESNAYGSPPGKAATEPSNDAAAAAAGEERRVEVSQTKGVLAGPEAKWRWWHVAVGILALIVIAAMFGGGSPELRVTVTGRPGFQAIHVQNIGKKPVVVQGITVNERKDCQPRSAINLDNPSPSFVAEKLDVGDSSFWATGCRVVRADVVTDKGKGSYEFK